MKKRRNMAYLYTFFTIVLMCAMAVFVINSDRRFVVKTMPYLATELEFGYLESDDFSSENTINYVISNNINTVILPINNGYKSIVELTGFENLNAQNRKYDKKDYVSQTKAVLTKNKVQLYLSLDCTGLSDENILTAVREISDKYAIAAIILKNYNGNKDLLQTVSQNVPSKCELIIYCDNSQLSQFADSAEIDGYICTDMNYNQYQSFKNTTDKKVFLHYNSKSMYSDLFVATNFGSMDGAIVSSYNGNYEKLSELDYAIRKDKELPLFNLTVSSDFAVTYPTKDITTYYSGVFITGTGAQGTVNVNGFEHPSAVDGTFGVYFELAEGENPVTVACGGESESFTVTRKIYKSSGSTVKHELPWDDSVKLNPGRIIRTTSQLTSVLSDPEDDSAIIAGLDQGTKLIVAQSVEAERGGEKTYVYQLTNGGYIPSAKVEILDEVTAEYKPSKKEKITDYTVYETPDISDVTLQKFENGDRQLQFSVNNMPGITHQFSQDKLSVVFMDTAMDDVPVPVTDFYTDFEIIKNENSLQIDFLLNPEKPLWGYDVKSEEGTVTVYFKDIPHLSDCDQPLQGITVMLDPGHGGKDSGALGVASVNGPLEKDLNFAVAQATQAILENKGATVIMTREDDTFPTLDDRRNMVRELKPDLFIAIHHNSMDYSYNSTKARGSECYYFTHQSQHLAQLMTDNVTAATGRLNRGAFNGYYYVTRTDIAPSVLMEYGFMINPTEFSTLYHNTDIYKAAYGTAQAVLKAIPQ
ncbi:MAG: N-acetylmuramoyl-L-alanine amidase [Oscillospiraceae bacterium]|nr:N-acetylmuramoyl-L-alanine amidase [Oscillospiraceae bacterium]